MRIHLFRASLSEKPIFDRLTQLPAQAFWRKVIGEYSAGSHVERIRDDEKWQGAEQVFQSKRRTK